MAGQETNLRVEMKRRGVARRYRRNEETDSTAPGGGHNQKERDSTAQEGRHNQREPH